jgi:hypothetical protein
MRRRAFATLILVATAAVPSLARSEARLAIEVGAAFGDAGQSAAQGGARLSFGARDAWGGNVSLGLLPSYFEARSLGAVLDGAVVRSIPFGRFVLEPQAGLSLLAVASGFVGLAVGGNVGLGLTTEVQEDLSLGVRFTYRRLRDWDESYDLSTLSGVVSFPIGRR